MSMPHVRRAAVRVIGLCSVLAGIAGCDRATTPTEPQRTPPARPAAHDSTDLTCRSGWQFIDGRYVCLD